MKNLYFILAVSIVLPAIGEIPIYVTQSPQGRRESTLKIFWRNHKKKVAIIGAAGVMGAGIALFLRCMRGRSQENQYDSFSAALAESRERVSVRTTHDTRTEGRRYMVNDTVQVPQQAYSISAPIDDSSDVALIPSIPSSDLKANLVQYAQTHILVGHLK